ncbi:MAG: hypothetical protein WBF87_00505, partial [Mesorhizobium sp.]
DGEGWGYRAGEASLLELKSEWGRTDAWLTATETLTGKARPALDVMCVGLGRRIFESELPG